MFRQGRQAMKNLFKLTFVVIEFSSEKWLRTRQNVGGNEDREYPKFFFYLVQPDVAWPRIFFLLFSFLFFLFWKSWAKFTGNRRNLKAPQRKSCRHLQGDPLGVFIRSIFTQIVLEFLASSAVFVFLCFKN